MLEVVGGFRADHQESMPVPTLEASPPKGDEKKEESPAAEAEAPGSGMRAGNLSRRGLRRKPDFTDQQLGKIDLETLQNFRSYLTADLIPKRQLEDAETAQKLDFVYSTKQMANCRRLVEQKNMLSDIDSLSQGPYSQQRRSSVDSTKNVPAVLRVGAEDLAAIKQFAAGQNGNAFSFVTRNLLLWGLQSPQLTMEAAASIYSVFVNLLKPEPEDVKPFDYHLNGRCCLVKLLGRKRGAVEALLMLFEISLFNKIVTKAYKSIEISQQRQVLADYLEKNEVVITQMLADDEPNEAA